MSTKSLTEAFEVKPKTFSSNNVVADYDIFANKSLLEELRTKIVQNLVEESIPNNELLEDYINNEIDETLVGYDLSMLERRYIFNLIQNEIEAFYFQIIEIKINSLIGLKKYKQAYMTFIQCQSLLEQIDLLNIYNQNFYLINQKIKLQNKLKKSNLKIV